MGSTPTSSSAEDLGPYSSTILFYGHFRSRLGMVFYLPKNYLDFVFINLVKYHLDSKAGKLPILCTVIVNLETSKFKLGRVLFHKNSYIRCPLCFTESVTLLKVVKKPIFLRENAVFNVVSQFNINETLDSLQ